MVPRPGVRLRNLAKGTDFTSPRAGEGAGGANPTSMGLTGWIRDLRETQHNLSELLSNNTAEERAASLEIAQSASRFSRRAREVVDDKLTFSATLMRAGEVSAATRLLAEVEEEVRSEEIALIETVNEVKVAQAVRRGRITRLRLARSMAVAMLGACVLAFSAVGMAVAGAFNERERTEAVAPLRVDAQDGAVDRDRQASLSAPARRLMRRLQIGNVNLVLTQGEFRMLRELTGGSVDEEGLHDVMSLLPRALAEKVQEVMTLATDTVNSPESVLEIEPTPDVKRISKAKKKADRPPREEAAPEQEPTDDSSDDGSTSSDGDGGGKEDRDGDDAGNNEGGEGTILPLPDPGL